MSQKYQIVKVMLLGSCGVLYIGEHGGRELFESAASVRPGDAVVVIPGGLKPGQEVVVVDVDAKRVWLDQDEVCAFLHRNFPQWNEGCQWWSSPDGSTLPSFQEMVRGTLYEFVCIATHRPPGEQAEVKSKIDASVFKFRCESCGGHFDHPASGISENECPMCHSIAFIPNQQTDEEIVKEMYPGAEISVSMTGWQIRDVRQQSLSLLSRGDCDTPEQAWADARRRIEEVKVSPTNRFGVTQEIVRMEVLGC